MPISKPLNQQTRLVKLAVVITHPIQHWVPVYVALAKQECIQLKVFFIAENGVKPYVDKQFNQKVTWDIPLLEGYEYQFLEPGKIIQDFSFNEVDSKHLGDELKRFTPDVLWLNGYSHKANWRALLSKPSATKVIYSSDSNLTDPRSVWKKAIKHLVVRYFLSKCAAFLSVGPQNQRYLEHYGVSSNKVHQVPYPIDMQRILKAKQQLPMNSRQQLRQNLNIPESATALLFLGKLIAHKRPQDIIEALSQLSDDNVFVIYVGSGDMLEELQALSKQRQVQTQVKFVGFVNQSMIPAYTDASDVLVLPSSKEPFGAVVSEVLPFGLPVIVSDAIGAIGSSALPNENALVYACGDAQELAEKIAFLKQNPQRCAEMSQASRRQTMLHDTQQYAKVLLEACGIRA